MEVVPEYSKIRKLGVGAYGKVYLVRLNGEEFAVKRLKMDNKGVDISTIREIKILKEIEHPHIIRMVDAFVEKKKRMCLLMEYIPLDLRKLVDNKLVVFTENESLEIIYQILTAINFIHKQGILHRDIKPSNILLTKEGSAKLIDFGLSRHFDGKDDPLTKNVNTRWYRPPEILYGAVYYGTKIDIWALGCVLAELILKKPLFPGNSEIDQLSKIFGIRGSINDSNWPEVKKLPFYFEFEYCYEIPMEKILYPASKEVVDIIDKMLSLNPNFRPSANTLLELPAFKNLDHAELISSIKKKLEKLNSTH